MSSSSKAAKHMVESGRSACAAFGGQREVIDPEGV